MNYQALKRMVENLVNTYICPECGEHISDNNLDIIGAAGNSANIDIFCPKCKKNSIIKSEIYSVDLGSFNFNKDNIENLKNAFLNSQGKNNPIKDNQIIDLNNTLKNANSVFDIIGEEIK